jgi:hypothetical protein
MKYTLYGFSQNKAIEFGLDLNDLAILRYIVDFKDSKNMSTEVVDGECYYWVKYEGILKELPILKIKKDSIYRRLKTMCKIGILKHKTFKRAGTYSFYTLGPKYIELVDDSNDSSVSEKNPNGIEENPRGSEINPIGSDSNPERVGNKSVRGTDLNPEQNINLLKDPCCYSNNILQEITNYYCDKAGTVEFNISAAETQVMIDLLKTIPVDVIKSGIDESFKNFKPKFDGDKINSFKYCEPIVKKLWSIKNGLVSSGSSNKSYKYGKKESTFNNFKQRTYDFKDLEKKLLGWDNENSEDDEGG